MPVFADTFYYLALINPHDRAHDLAVAFTQDFDGALITSGYVLMELGDALAGRPDRSSFAAVLEKLRSDSRIQVVSPSDALFDAAADLYAHRPDKEWSLTDCTSFVIMGERGLSDALTGDHHFEQAGFRALLR